MGARIITPIQKRFSDVDSFLHVNNVAQQMYFDIGKTEYYRQILGMGNVGETLRIITVATHTSYMGQIRMEDEVFVTTEVTRIGTTSMEIEQKLICRLPDGREQVRSESRSTMVAFDFARQEKFPIPDAWHRHMLSPDTEQ